MSNGSSFSLSSPNGEDVLVPPPGDFGVPPNGAAAEVNATITSTHSSGCNRVASARATDLAIMVAVPLAFFGIFLGVVLYNRRGSHHLGGAPQPRAIENAGRRRKKKVAPTPPAPAVGGGGGVVGDGGPPQEEGAAAAEEEQEDQFLDETEHSGADVDEEQGHVTVVAVP